MQTNIPKKYLIDSKLNTRTPNLHLSTLLAQLSASRPTVSTPVYSDEENTPSRVWVHVVHVLLSLGEEYEKARSYNEKGRKLVSDQREVVSGVDKPWDVIKNCHKFRIPMYLENECIEILWIRKGDHRDTVHEIWDQGNTFQSMSAYPFLFEKDWNVSTTPLRLSDGDRIEIRLRPYVSSEDPRSHTKKKRG